MNKLLLAFLILHSISASAQQIEVSPDKSNVKEHNFTLKAITIEEFPSIGEVSIYMPYVQQSDVKIWLFSYYAEEGGSSWPDTESFQNICTKFGYGKPTDYTGDSRDKNGWFPAMSGLDVKGFLSSSKKSFKVHSIFDGNNKPYYTSHVRCRYKASGKKEVRL